MPPHGTAAGAGPSGRRLWFWAVLWPAVGLARAGFAERALAFGIGHGLLIAYGLLALAMHRSSGWIYLAVAVLIHIEGVFAQVDFAEAHEIESTPISD